MILTIFDLMEASKTDLRTLLEGAIQFQIPLFQRSYCWQKINGVSYGRI